MRLGVYSNESPKRLLWDSGSLSNTTTADWIDVQIASATPDRLALTAGTYWLAWQIDTTEPVPGYIAGASGDGFAYDQPFGAFPATLAGEQVNAETWGITLDFHPSAGRAAGDFDDSGCIDLADFLFLLDYWFAEVPGMVGGPIELPDFLALLDNWQSGDGCQPSPRGN